MTILLKKLLVITFLTLFSGLMLAGCSSQSSTTINVEEEDREDAAEDRDSDEDVDLLLDSDTSLNLR